MVNGRRKDMLRKLLAFAAVAEVGTGLALLVIPAIVVQLLIGVIEAGEGHALARLAGIALLALGLACWPSGERVLSRSPAFRAMLIYNVLIVLFLTYLYVVVHVGGVLLWPAVALHAVVAVLLVWTWCEERRERAGDA